MNITLWILQAVLAFFYLAGGAYKTFKFDELAAQFDAIPRNAWAALGVLEMVGALLLIVPAALKWQPSLTPIAASILAVETLAIAALYARYSLKLTAENPLLWAAVMAVLIAFVAYGRFVVRPVV